MKKITLSIIIVEYKSGSHLHALLQAIPTHDDWEVIVIDNSYENKGYGGGCNSGAEKARGRYLLFLNPDVLPKKHAIEDMFEYLEHHPKVGIVGPKFINEDGKTELSSTEHPSFWKAFFSLSFFNSLVPGLSLSSEYWIKAWNRESTKEVSVISGATMMVRKDDFMKAGAFDPQFFLYWEEFDLCKRMENRGKSTVFLASSIFHHPQRISMKQADFDVSDVFRKSRFVYFKKHLGLVQGIILELWFALTEQWRILFLIGLAFYLRTMMPTHIPLIGDVGRDYLYALNVVRGQEIPLLGIPSSIPRFSQGPLNIWFDSISFILGGFTVFSPPLFAAVLTTMGAGALYCLLERTVGKQASFFGSLFFAVSVTAVMQSRMPFYLFAVPVFLVVYLWCLSVVKNSSRRSVFFVVFTYFFLLQWELATLSLILLLPLSFFLEKISIKKHWIGIVGATIMGLLPQIVFDITHRCSHLCGLVGWVGYRIVAVSGFDGRHGLSGEAIARIVTKSFDQFLSFVGQENGSTLYAVGVLVFLSFFYAFRHQQTLKKHSLYVYAIFGSMVLSLSIFIHGFPSEAYFPPYLVFIVIFLAHTLFWMPKRAQRIAIFFLIFFYAKQVYFLQKDIASSSSILDYLHASQWIVRDSKNEPIHLVSFDNGSSFNTYLDHIKFLVQTKGGKIEDSGKKYVVSFERETILPLLQYEKREFGMVRVVKKSVY
ncbi:MAG: glycosyltransferase [Candidatus Pacebacteria bacterium]|nr:glycosyltransferase [Candidatus Paceibacterota bacterium]